MFDWIARNLSEIIGAILLIGLVVCVVGLVVSVATGPDPQTGHPSANRFIDHEAGVVCWVYRGGFGGGISCLPLDETSLAVEVESTENP